MKCLINYNDLNYHELLIFCNKTGLILEGDNSIFGYLQHMTIDATLRITNYEYQYGTQETANTKEGITARR